MKRIALLALLLVLLMMPVMAQEEEEKKPAIIDGVAAVVNERWILISDILEIVMPWYMQARETYSKAELEKRREEVYDETLQALIERELVLSLYKVPNEELLDAYVTDGMNKLIAATFDGDPSKFREALAEEGMSLSEWRQARRDRIFISLIEQEELAGKIIVSPSMVQARYDRDKELYRSPEKVKVRMIVLQKGVMERERILKRRQAESIRKELAEGKSFASMAMQHSQGAKASRGGDWGWVAHEDLDEQLRDAAATLPAGEVSAVIETTAFLYIMKVESRRRAATIPLSQVREAIEEELREEEYLRVRGEWMDGLKKRAYIKIVQPAGTTPNEEADRPGSDSR